MDSAIIEAIYELKKSIDKKNEISELTSNRIHAMTEILSHLVSAIYDVRDEMKEKSKD